MLLDAIILPDAILYQARLWRDQAVMRWGGNEQFTVIGDTQLVSPVDARARTVRLMLGHGFREDRLKGFTVPTLRSPSGEIEGEGYTIILNRLLIALNRDPLTVILLHEIVHTIDPYFDEDIRRQEIEGEAEGEAKYLLPSEQRAFTAMWTDSLREDLTEEDFDLDAAIKRYALCSREFDYFYCFCLLTGGDLRNQTCAHFSTIVADLKNRGMAGRL